jgi:hypothetical protein
LLKGKAGQLGFWRTTAVPKRQAVHAIWVSDQVTRRLPIADGLDHLLCCPLGRGMFRHIEVQDLTAVMRKHNQNKQDPKRNGRYCEEVDRDKILNMVVQESLPVLRRGLGSSWHPSRDGSFRYFDPELQEFAVNSRCAPEGIRICDVPDQLPDLVVLSWSPWRVMAG